MLRRMENISHDVLTSPNLNPEETRDDGDEVSYYYFTDLIISMAET